MNIIFNNLKLFVSIVFWVFLIIVWHIYSGFMPSYQLPSPMMVATAMLNIVLDLDLIQQIGLSLFHIIASIFIAFCPDIRVRSSSALSINFASSFP